MTLSLGESFQTEVSTVVERTAYEKILLLNIAQQHGLLRRTSDWKSDHTENIFGISNPGHLSFEAYENAPDLGAGLTPVSAKLMALTGRLQLSPAQVANWQNSALGVNITPAELIGNQMYSMNRAIESILANGQAGRYLDDTDDLKRLTTDADYLVKGLLFDSGIQTIAGGTDADNNMAAFGDYYDTMNLIEKTMVDQGVDVETVYVFMDSTTMQYMKKSKSTNIWEVDQIKKSWPTWKFFSENTLLANGLTNNKYIWAIAPLDTNGAPTFKIIESMPMKAEVIGGGTLQSNGNYQWFVGWKGGVQINNGYGVVKTGALTLS